MFERSAGFFALPFLGEPNTGDDLDRFSMRGFNSDENGFGGKREELGEEGVEATEQEKGEVG